MQRAQAGHGAGVADRHRLRHARRRARHADAAAAADWRHHADRCRPGRRAACAWAARCWRRCWAASAMKCPTSTTRARLKALVAAINDTARRRPLLAYHDRSDGGLWAAVCEMAFAGHRGVSLNVDLLVTEGDGIADSRCRVRRLEELGQPGRRAPQRAHAGGAVQRGARRRDAGAHRRARRGDGGAACAWPVDRHSHTWSASRTTSGVVEIWRDAKAHLQRRRCATLHQAWDEVSWRIARQRDNPACADMEHDAAGRATTRACTCT